MPTNDARDQSSVGKLNLKNTK